MAVMDARPMQAGDDDVAAMRIFASRTEAELERRHQAAALRRSRARVIEAADAERQRVGRNLHDGAQQRLMAVSNLLKLAERKLDGGDGALDVLRLAGDELGEAQAELRSLARGLHPVALAERGLRSALESLTVGCEIPVTLDVDEQELPEQVEVAAYFIVSESLTNATKYACASAVEIRVAPEAQAVLVEIVDDGCGGADPDAGTGLRGLADRIEALGGRLEVDSPPGAGTRVSARLPLRTLDWPTVRMLAYNGSIPGPTLRVRQGSEIVVDVVNEGDLEATVHWHGLRLENRYDGTHETQAPIPIGGRFTYRLAFPDPGVYWYHPHIREDYGQEMGLYGNIIVDPADPDYWPPVAPRAGR